MGTLARAHTITAVIYHLPRQAVNIQYNPHGLQFHVSCTFIGRLWSARVWAYAIPRILHTVPKTEQIVSISIIKNADFINKKPEGFPRVQWGNYAFTFVVRRALHRGEPKQKYLPHMRRPL